MGNSQKKQQRLRANGTIADDMLSELLTFKALLESNYKVAENIDVGKLDVAVSAIKSCREQHRWGYEINGLIFRNLDYGGGLSSEKSFLELTIIISGLCQETNPISDILDSFCLQFVVKQRESEDIELKSSFRFERHIYKIDDSTPKFYHPLYHFQYGGDKITEDEDFDKGQVLFIDAPRVMHPPMDIVLAIDFVLGNFYSNERDGLTELFNNSDYLRIVEKAKVRFWKPYALGLTSNFTPNKSGILNHFNSLKVDSNYAQNLVLYEKRH